MIQSVWNKEIVAIVEMDNEDVSDNLQSLPLLLTISWNHYIGFYYEQITQFFMSNLPFPVKASQFWLQIPQRKVILNGTQIISHIVHIYELQIQKQPIRFVCHFRNNNPLPELNLKKYYKNSLKSSTAIRYGKHGASRLTVEMSINNVDDMFTNFKQRNILKYLGSSNFEDDNLGYRFLIAKSENIPIRIISKDFILERSCPKESETYNFLKQLLGEQIMLNTSIKMHITPINNFKGKMCDLEKYGHPDGFLYFYM